MKINTSPQLNEIIKSIGTWQDRKGRMMKSHIPTQDIVSLLEICARVDNKSAEEDELINKISDLIHHAVEMLTEH